MSKKDPRIDAYIAKSAEFSRPILARLRALVHQGCPEAQETLKWSMPWFEYKGLLCGMAAFKEHATFGFWQHRLILDKSADAAGMGQFGRITSLRDLPSDKTLLGYIAKAVKLKDSGVKSASGTRNKRDSKRELVVPDYLAAALSKNKRALTNFEKFSYSHKKEYVEWLTGAKREETREKRLSTALAWIQEGKPQNWKYMRC